MAVGLTPEMLPMIVTSTLAKGAVLLSRRKMSSAWMQSRTSARWKLTCTDKTGTLTQDREALERHTDVFGHDSEDVLKFAYLNSHFQTGLINLLDRAMLEHVNCKARCGCRRTTRWMRPVRHRAPPHVGGGVRARGPS